MEVTRTSSLVSLTLLYIVSIQSHLNPEPRASRVVCSTTTRFLQRNLANLKLDFQG